MLPTDPPGERDATHQTRSRCSEAERESEFFLWCDRLPGFGARIYPSGRKTFLAQVRVGRFQRRIKIGAYGPYTVEKARERGEAIIRAAAEGRDPQREKTEAKQALTVAELCDEYLEAARSGLVMTRFKRPKRAATVAIDEGRVIRHIKPLIGTIAARDLRRADVQRMADGIAKGKTAGTFKGKTRGRAVVTGGVGTAARVVELLGGILSWAEKRELVPGPNPAHGVETARGEAKDRVLNADELQALGKALTENEAMMPMAAGAAKLIALTGLRREEACGLRWAEIDLAGSCLRLETTKTGRSMRPIGKPARDVLQSLPRLSEEWVFPNRGGTGRGELKASIATLFNAAGLKDARSHDLRRTLGSIAANEGYGDATIAELLGHSRRGVTQRHYIRRPDGANQADERVHEAPA
ncbi:MAG TPA: site-specific integrase [Stellaceae bacterium]|nr:site-specific integrase [Stellaceae bacterium]